MQRLDNVSMITRAKKGKVYAAGTIIIQISASKGQYFILEEDSEVETKYATVQANEDVYPMYLYTVIGLAMDKFMNRLSTGINIQIDTLGEMEVDIRHDYDKQKEIADLVKKLEWQEKRIERAIKKMEDFKKYNLDGMFV
ncbi:restriction endonuclease subunit S [Macrococcoides canis]|uniref:restriction endonuclease subunit S n=1 Tax=Macrococcoides canis TaxID=1855823 RepID=UPI0020B83EBB|nr:restriction endonuclease subunit S [Macrococcus canis]UTH07931.1 restriction endonuclease subunit S [Macrococcus canis]